MNEQPYYEIRKVCWDALWHARYRTPDGRETWDRVTEEVALKIAKTLVYNENVKVVNRRDFERLERLCASLLEDLRIRVEDQADSSLPAWIAEAVRLGVPVSKKSP